MAPFLLGAAQAAYGALSDEQAQPYKIGKGAILDSLGLTSEAYHRWFRIESFLCCGEGAPREAAHLWDLAKQELIQTRLDLVYEKNCQKQLEREQTALRTMEM